MFPFGEGSSVDPIARFFILRRDFRGRAPRRSIDHIHIQLNFDSYRTVGVSSVAVGPPPRQCRGLTFKV